MIFLLRPDYLFVYHLLLLAKLNFVAKKLFTKKLASFFFFQSKCLSIFIVLQLKSVFIWKQHLFVNHRRENWTKVRFCPDLGHCAANSPQMFSTIFDTFFPFEWNFHAQLMMRNVRRTSSPTDNDLHTIKIRIKDEISTSCEQQKLINIKTFLVNSIWVWGKFEKTKFDLIWSTN